MLNVKEDEVPYVLIIHEVEDYPAWKKILRKQAGVKTPDFLYLQALEKGVL